MVFLLFKLLILGLNKILKTRLLILKDQYERAGINAIIKKYQERLLQSQDGIQHATQTECYSICSSRYGTRENFGKTPAYHDVPIARTNACLPGVAKKKRSAVSLDNEDNG